MSYVMFAATAIGALLTVLSIFSLTELWQRKEYRLDRLRLYLTSDEFRTSLITILFFVLALSNIAWYAFIFNYHRVAIIIGWLELLLIGLYHIIRIKQRGFFRPKGTLKAFAVLGTTTIITSIYLILFYVPANPIALQWATLLIFLPYITALSVGLITIPVVLRKQQIIHRATRHRAKYKQIKVIGITGSFGKTSTKEFLLQILRAHTPHAIATKEHRNAAYVVAIDVLEQLNDQVSHYVVEMGAYRVGEIADIVKITRPTIGVITAISNQHLGLFGSREKLAKAKWELMDGLPSQGIAVINLDDAMVRKLSVNLKQTQITYSLIDQSAHVHASNIVYESERTQFQLTLRDQTQSLTLFLPGEGHLQNAVAAAAAALGVGIPSENIFATLPHLTAPPKTMQIIHHDELTIIDDSYSGNEIGTLAAIEHIQRFKTANKVIVLQPLIELGQEAVPVHQRIGAALATTNATVIVSGNSYHEALQTGYGTATRPALEFITDPAELTTRLQILAKPSTVILLEGRLPAIARDALLNKVA